MLLSTIEQEWAHNIVKQSCIPCGFYTIKKRWSFRHGNHLHILDVAGRSLILIHVGNFNFQTTGCVLVGTGLKDINNDGQIDTINSKLAMKKLLALLPLECVLKIENAPNLWPV